MINHFSWGGDDGLALAAVAASRDAVQARGDMGSWRSRHAFIYDSERKRFLKSLISSCLVLEPVALEPEFQNPISLRPMDNSRKNRLPKGKADLIITRGWSVGMLVIGLVGLFASLTPRTCSAMSISRDEALAEFNASRTRILANIDADPTQAANDLIFFVVRPIRYHAKVMALCDELVAKSTTTAGIEATLSALDLIAASSAADLRAHGEFPHVQKLIDFGLKSDDLMVRLLAARVLATLGPDFAAKKIDAYQKIFASSPVQIDNGLRVFSRDDIRFELVDIIRKLLPQVKTNKRIRLIVRQATEKYNLLAFFRSYIENPRQPGTVEERFQIFNDWQRLMAQPK